MSDVPTTLEELQHFLETHYLRGSGLSRDRSASPAPRTGAAAEHWRWTDIQAGLMASGKLVPVGPQGMTEMRSVTGIGGPKRSISMNAQILMPGERTRAHRNMKNETRLVWEAPEGAVFVCDGEAFPMRRGDLIVSPTWTFHDHYNGGDTPAIWVDGYDNGYATLGEAGKPLNERYPVDAPYQEILRPNGYGLQTRGHVRPWSEEAEYPQPPMCYPWAEVQAALHALREAEVEGDPYDGLHLLYTNPVDGGATLPTMAWHVQLLTPRQRTLPHRHNSTTCYHVFEGAGVTEIEGERVEWGPGDLFVVPPWRWHHHENGTGQDAILFSIDDWPAMKKLGFYKKEGATEVRD